MPYARVGQQEWEWVPPGEAYFEYTGPERVWLKPWETAQDPASRQASAKAAPVVELGTRPEAELEQALGAIANLPGLTGALRGLAREFGSVDSKKFVDTAARVGINSHTATKQFRLGRKGII